MAFAAFFVIVFIFGACVGAAVVASHFQDKEIDALLDRLREKK